MKKSVWLIPVFSLIILAFTVHRGEVPRTPASAATITASTTAPVAPAVAPVKNAKAGKDCPELLKKVTDKK